MTVPAEGALGRVPSPVMTALAETLKLNPKVMIEAIKATCFKCDHSKVTDAQLATFCSVAANLNLNPLIPGMLYAYPKDGGIVAMTGPDGVFQMLANRKEIDYWEVEPEIDERGALVAATATIYTHNRTQPFRKRVLLSEWRVDSNPNWKARPQHMLEMRALKQCARYVIHGLPIDEEELQIIRATESREAPSQIAGKPLQIPMVEVQVQRPAPLSTRTAPTATWPAAAPTEEPPAAGEDELAMDFGGEVTSAER